MWNGPQTSLSTEGLAALKAPLDIPIPDPAKEEAKQKKKEEVQTFHPIQRSIMINPLDYNGIT